MRWTELAAFTTVFRTHEGNIPEVNHQIYSDEDTSRHFSRFAKVYAAWKPYRMELVKEASESGLPVVRHPFVHYPDDPEVLGLEHQFMVGPDLMVAPVLDAGEETVEVYLPKGRWVHLWSGREYGSLDKGVYETVRAPIGEPAVFYEEGSDVGRWSKIGRALVVRRGHTFLATNTRGHDIGTWVETLRMDPAFLIGGSGRSNLRLSRVLRRSGGSSTTKSAPGRSGRRR